MRRPWLVPVLLWITATFSAALPSAEAGIPTQAAAEEPDPDASATGDDPGDTRNAGSDQTPPEIWLATFAPGEVYWQRFGHNALIVSPPGEPATSYNFGYFDFHQPRFLRRFLRGRVYYQSLDLPADQDLPAYAEEGRSVYLQTLALTSSQAERLAAELRHAVLPANRDYLYDYFRANCSTRLRDALDLALDGELRRQTSGRSRGYTYRMHSLRLAEGDFWLSLGIDLGLGPFADRPLSFWDEMFIPELMRRHLRDFTRPDGTGLVAAESAWFDSSRSPPPELASDHRLPFVLTGIGIALGLLWLSARARRRPAAAGILRGLGFGLHLLFGLAGAVLLALWLATDHVAAHGNENLFLLSPLSLLLAPLWLRRGRRAGAAAPKANPLATLVAISATFGLVSKTVPDVFTQANLHWCLLLLPIHLALWRAWCSAAVALGTAQQTKPIA